MFNLSSLFDPWRIFVGLLATFLVLPIHEFSHALAADKLGDHTARNRGRLTMNPLAHLDPIGAIALVLTGFGWAKPVPVNPFFFKNRKNRNDNRDSYFCGDCSW